jgi:hypothetical protein
MQPLHASSNAQASDRGATGGLGMQDEAVEEIGPHSCLTSPSLECMSVAEAWLVFKGSRSTAALGCFVFAGAGWLIDASSF